MLIVMRRKSVLDRTSETDEIVNTKVNMKCSDSSIQKYLLLFDYRHAIRKFLISRLSKIPKKFEGIWNKQSYWFAYLEDP